MDKPLIAPGESETSLIIRMPLESEYYPTLAYERSYVEDRARMLINAGNDVELYEVTRKRIL